MVLVVGLVFLLSGAVLAAWNWAEFWPVLRGCLILSLFFWGAIFFVVGFSERRARKHYRDATQNDGALDSTESKAAE